MRHSLIPLVAVASLFSLSALADDAPLGDWNSQGGYAGISGGFAFGGRNTDTNTLDTDKWRYTDEAPVDTGWQGTAEGGVVMPLGKVDWLRLRVGGELGYGQYDLDTYRDTFSGDTVSGDFSLLRVGPAAAVDFHIPNTPWSFTAGVGAGVGVLDLNSTVANGVVVSNGGGNHTTAYVSGLIAANYALTPTLDLSLGLRTIWLAEARINGTTTTVSGVPYSVRHEVQPASAVELGLRWKF